MTYEEEADIRLECLHMATRCMGETCSYQTVLVASKDYYEWVIGKKSHLRVVSNDTDGGVA